MRKRLCAGLDEQREQSQKEDGARNAGPISLVPPAAMLSSNTPGKLSPTLGTKSRVGMSRSTMRVQELAAHPAPHKIALRIGRPVEGSVSGESTWTSCHMPEIGQPPTSADQSSKPASGNPDEVSARASTGTSTNAPSVHMPAATATDSRPWAADPHST